MHAGDLVALEYTAHALWIASLSPHNARVLGEQPGFISRLAAWISLLTRVQVNNEGKQLWDPLKKDANKKVDSARLQRWERASIV